MLSVSAASAADNVTSDDLADLGIGESVPSDSLKNEDTNNDDNFNVSDDVLAVGENDDVLSMDSPAYDQYSLTVHDTTISAGSSGTVTVYINPVDSDYGDYYAYDFYFKVYDSNGNQKISKNLYSSIKSSTLFLFFPNTFAYLIALFFISDFIFFNS